MMVIRLHQVPGDPGLTQKPKRVGRGESSGHGRTSGRGNKGAGQHAGARKGKGFEGGQMPLVRRIPKFGFSNAAFRRGATAVTLRQLNGFADGSTIDRRALLGAGLIRKKDRFVKLICKGKLERRLTVCLQGFSPGAKTAVEARGGRWEIVAS
jgi:large subunit ribosomal protein L15